MRGVKDRTSVSWKPGVVDDVFELLGDADLDGQAGHNQAGSNDYAAYEAQNGSGANGTPPGWELYSADFNDDGYVTEDDIADFNDWFGNELDLFDIAT